MAFGLFCCCCFFFGGGVLVLGFVFFPFLVGVCCFFCLFFFAWVLGFWVFGVFFPVGCSCSVFFGLVCPFFWVVGFGGFGCFEFFQFFVAFGSFLSVCLFFFLFSCMGVLLFFHVCCFCLFFFAFWVFGCAFLMFSKKTVFAGWVGGFGCCLLVFLGVLLVKAKESPFKSPVGLDIARKHKQNDKQTLKITKEPQKLHKKKRKIRNPPSKASVPSQVGWYPINTADADPTWVTCFY